MKMQTDPKTDVMTNEDSYTERRQLFKTIWETAMNIEEKEDFMNKPKVIKTLRLDEVDKFVIGKSKKQRIKNLRHVCKKILDFCDRQDADDIFYEQIAAGVQEPGQTVLTMESPKRTKKHKIKKKVKKAKSMFTPINSLARTKKTVSERKDELKKISSTKTPRPVPIQIKRTPLVKRNFITKAIKKTGSKKIGAKNGSSSFGNPSGSNTSTTRPSVVNKRRQQDTSDKPSKGSILPAGILDGSESDS